MGPYRAPASEAPDRREPKPDPEDPLLAMLVALVSAPIVISALAAGVTWGVGESLAAAALVLAAASLLARPRPRGAGR